MVCLGVYIVNQSNPVHSWMRNGPPGSRRFFGSPNLSPGIIIEKCVTGAS